MSSEKSKAVKSAGGKTERHSFLRILNVCPNKPGPVSEVHEIVYFLILVGSEHN